MEKYFITDFKENPEFKSETDEENLIIDRYGVWQLINGRPLVVDTSNDIEYLKDKYNIQKKVAEISNKDGNQVASIAVMTEGEILMGKRNDNGKWTLPGGHSKQGENPIENAIRELKEETGITATEQELTYLGQEPVEAEGKTLLINCFLYNQKEKTNTSHDPDEECDEWEYIDIGNGLPKEILNNLHSNPNITLQFLGLQEKDMKKKSMKNYNVYMTDVPMESDTYNEYFETELEADNFIAGAIGARYYFEKRYKDEKGRFKILDSGYTYEEENIQKYKKNKEQDNNEVISNLFKEAQDEGGPLNMVDTEINEDEIGEEPTAEDMGMGDFEGGGDMGGLGGDEMGGPGGMEPQAPPLPQVNYDNFFIERKPDNLQRTLDEQEDFDIDFSHLV